MARDRNPAEDALDTVVSMLQSVGRHSFDVDERTADEVHVLCEAWARHVAYGEPPPGIERGDGSDGQRDWGTLRQAFRQLRQQEARHVAKSLGDLRQALMDFAAGLNRAVEEDRDSGAAARTQLDRLKAAIASNSIEAIKKEAARTVSLVTDVLEQRQERLAKQVRTLDGQMKLLGQQVEEAKREGSLDPLTQLYNRKAFDEQLARAVAMRAVFADPWCLLLIDVDHFKAINDTYGHPAGDAVLKQLANCLSRSFPRKGDTLARYGGEEFAVVLRNAGMTDARRLGERLLGSVRALRFPGLPDALQVTISIGLAELAPGDSDAVWLERADRALYLSKHGGRDRITSLTGDEARR